VAKAGKKKLIWPVQIPLILSGASVIPLFVDKR